MRCRIQWFPPQPHHDCPLFHRALQGEEAQGLRGRDTAGAGNCGGKPQPEKVPDLKEAAGSGERPTEPRWGSILRFLWNRWIAKITYFEDFEDRISWICDSYTPAGCSLAEIVLWSPGFILRDGNICMIQKIRLYWELHILYPSSVGGHLGSRWLISHTGLTCHHVINSIHCHLSYYPKTITRINRWIHSTGFTDDSFWYLIT